VPLQRYVLYGAVSMRLADEELPAVDGEELPPQKIRRR
jgi:hypothetical protein